MKIKTILVSQEMERTPYNDLAQKYNLKVDFRPFTQVEGLNAKEFKKLKINILDFTAIIFTSKTAIDIFFKICEELKITIPETMKYFCMTENIAYYLQKYIVYRKRKISYANGKCDDLIEIIQKHKAENFLIPLSDIQKHEITQKLEKNKYNFTKAVIYRTTYADLKDLEKLNYDILVFFTPTGVDSLISNFPTFKQDNIKIAAFGPITAKAIKDAGLRLDIKAPTPTITSMSAAIEQYIKKNNKN